MDQEFVTLDEIKSIETQSGGYSVTINAHTHARLERHILILKKLIDRHATKQRWITDAIKEKLSIDASIEEIPKANTLNVKIDDELDKQLLTRIEFMRKFRSSYSKKKWLLDAILEKLERDDAKVEKKILEKKQSLAESYKQQVEQLQAELAELKLKLLKYQSNT